MTKALTKFRKLNHLLTKQEMALALDTSDDPIHKRLAVLLRGIDPLTGARLPELERMSLATLCHRAGAKYDKILAAFKEYKRSEAMVIAALGLPATIQGIVEDAQPSERTCAACEGTGIIVTKPQEGKQEEEGFSPAEFKKCIPCEGSGKVRVPGDPVARKQMLEMMELSGRGATNINAQNAQVLVAAGESLEETLRAARRRATTATESKSDDGDDKLINIPTEGKVQ